MSADVGSILTVLGSSSGDPHPERNCSGYVLQTGERLSLIDCGGGVSSAFRRFGFDPEKVDRVFISHSHADHCSDLPLFLQMLYLTRRTNRLDIYVPDEYVVPLQLSMRAMYLLVERFTFPLEVHGYADGFTFDSPFTLTAVANTHMAKLHEIVAELKLPNRCQCHSFKIRAGGSAVFYSGDIGGLDDLRPHVGGCDLVLTELTHVDLDEFVAFALTTDVGRWIITHLGDNEDTARMCDTLQRAGLTNVGFAEDGLEISL